MKRITAILTMSFIFSVCITNAVGVKPVYGHGHESHSVHGSHYGNHSGHGNHSGCQKYVDANGDGICDNMKYSIKYNLNGGKNNKKNPSCYYNAANTIKLKNPTKKGCTFKGWYADRQCKKKVTAIKTGSNGTKTLYAKWAKK